MSPLASLSHPAALLPWSVLLLGLALAVAVAHRRSERALQRLVGARPGRGARLRRELAALAALAAIAVAALGPRAGTREIVVPGGGLDLVVLLDLSRSMDAGDTPPSRLARVRRLAEGILAGLLEGDRAALAVFAGRGALLTPLTSDRRALIEMLPALDSSLMSDGASSGAAGVEAALQAFDVPTGRPRVLLVLSDGEIGGIPVPLRRALVRKEVRVVAALVGTERGSGIRERGRWLLDADGEPVRTRRSTTGLDPLVAASDGERLLADAWGEIDPDALRASVRREAIPSPDGQLRRRVPAIWVAPPAGLALALLVLGAWPGPLRVRARPRAAKRRPHGSRGRRLQTVVLLAGVGLLPAAGADPEPDARSRLEAALAAGSSDARLLIELGIERARAGAAEEAALAFRAAALRAHDPTRAALAWYDLGVLALEQGRLQEARDAFFDATTGSRGSPALDREAKYNLEWTLARLRPEPKEAPRPAAEGEPEEARPEPTQPELASPPTAVDRELTSPPTAVDREPIREPTQADATPPSGTEADAQVPGAESAREEDAAAGGAPHLDALAAQRWLDAVDDNVRAALEAQLAPLRGMRRGIAW